jgi:N-acetylglutamate synthase-like GNAT family acetyltransferase
MPSTAAIVVRDARPGEGAALSALMLRSKAHWGYDDAFMDACRTVLVIPEAQIAAGEVLVAERDGDVVGVAAITDAPPEMELDVCFVDPVAIGHGVGRMLVDAAKRRARDAGAHRMRVQSDPNAEQFYVALGAVRVGEAASEIDARRLLPVLRFDLTA